MRSQAQSAYWQLLHYALENGLTLPEDAYYARNGLLDALALEAPPANPSALDPIPPTATPMLEALTEDAISRGLIADSAASRERFFARLMGQVTQSASQVIRHFHGLCAQEGSQGATAWFYTFCRKSDYIRVDALEKNRRFFAQSPYGRLEITINLAKPEKDPRDIAALLKKTNVDYPPCMLCLENQGYAGRADYPARQTLRLIPLSLDGERYYLQYSPYLYYPEHCIVLGEHHVPMSISRTTFVRLLAFLDLFPHYFIGSNADLPIVGGSILDHDHFQGGCHTFPMQFAPCWAQLFHPDFPQVSFGLVQWPLTTLRLTATEAEPIVDAATRILEAWRSYSDASAGIRAYTGETRHNTITPIARREGGAYVMDMVLRNNRTTDDCPLGLFHPHNDLHHVKKENIGLIEVMGLFILPGRLDYQLTALAPYLTGEKPLESLDQDVTLAAHAPWVKGIAGKTGAALSCQAARKALEEALSERCSRVLEDAGVFKLTDEGRQGLLRFGAQMGLEPCVT